MIRVLIPTIGPLTPEGETQRRLAYRNAHRVIWPGEARHEITSEVRGERVGS